MRATSITVWASAGGHRPKDVADGSKPGRTDRAGRQREEIRGTTGAPLASASNKTMPKLPFAVRSHERRRSEQRAFAGPDSAQRRTPRREPRGLAAPPPPHHRPRRGSRDRVQHTSSPYGVRPSAPEDPRAYRGHCSADRRPGEVGTRSPLGMTNASRPEVLDHHNLPTPTPRCGVEVSIAARSTPPANCMDRDRGVACEGVDDRLVGAHKASNEMLGVTGLVQVQQIERVSRRPTRTRAALSVRNSPEPPIRCSAPERGPLWVKRSGWSTPAPVRSVPPGRARTGLARSIM